MYHSIKDQTKELEARSERKKGQRKTNFLYMTHDQTGKKIKAAKNKERFTTSLKLSINKTQIWWKHSYYFLTFHDHFEG